MQVEDENYKLAQYDTDYLALPNNQKMKKWLSS